MAEISIRGVGKRYPNGVEAIRDVDLDIADGEFLVLVGPSGCGKSTLLRMIAGLEETTSGSVLIGGRDVTNVDPRHRNIAMVFQSYALYPHMTVAKNIGYPLKLAGVASADIDDRVRTVAGLLELDGVLDRRPSQLSGGQRQRVAMGRAIVRKPAAFLMDEPLSNLDAKLRVQMRAEIAHLQREFLTTTVYVTHDQVEAMTMGDRVAVLNAGRIEQCAPPRELYDAPANLFVAAFIGSPMMNLFAGTVERRNDGLHAVAGAVDIPLADTGQSWDPRVGDVTGQPVTIGLRPEALGQRHPGATGPACAGTVRFVEELGSELLAHIEPVGMPATSTLISRLGPRTGVRPGSQLELEIDPDQVHLFDAAGESLRDRDRP